MFDDTMPKYEQGTFSKKPWDIYWLGEAAYIAWNKTRGINTSKGSCHVSCPFLGENG